MITTASYYQAESYADRRIFRNRRRRSLEIKRNLILSLMTACLIVLLAFTMSGFLSDAKSGSEPVVFKYYTSIQVESGSSLWTIAEDYMGTQYESAEEYVNEVIRINALQDETIFAGQHLIIPYYSEQFIG